MSTLTLQRNVQFLYEEHLARVELAAFGCDQPQKDENDAWRFEAHVNGNGRLILERSAYIGTIDGQATRYSGLITPAYQGGRFNRTRSVNQYLTHWIYPYRGKFHPQMVRGLLNILKVQPGDLVLDPFSGSGTTALEASVLGADCVGVDQSPVCELVGRVKTESWQVAQAIKLRAEELANEVFLNVDRLDPGQEADERIGNFIRVAKLVTCSDVSRRRREQEPAFRKNLAQMAESVEAHAAAISHYGLIPGETRIVRGDARDLSRSGIAEASIDAIVTSPPYSIALDYVKNDEHALEELGVSLDGLREHMVGVRGKGVGKKLAAYNDDMQRAFAEMARVLKPGGGAAVVVGDATVGGEEVTTTSEMIDWAQAVGLRLERNIPKIVFGLYNVMNDEKILVFRKG